MTSTGWNDLAMWLAHIDGPTAAVLLLVAFGAGFVLGYTFGVGKK